MRAVAPGLVYIILLAAYEDGVSVKARKVEAPPEKPRVEVATQRVEVPVVWRTMPAVPTLFTPSRSAPVIYVLPKVEVPATLRLPLRVDEAAVMVPVKVGEPAKTSAPVPVSSVTRVSSSEDESISVPKITALSR